MATYKGKLRQKGNGGNDVLYPETSADMVVGLGAQVIVLEENGSTTAGTWLAKTDRISSLAEGQLFLYKVAVAGASTTKLNITGSAGTALGAKTIYRYGTTKLTTQYAVGSYILLYYNGSAFTAVNDYDANSYAYVRQYQAGPAGAGTGTKYPILTRYNLTDKNGSYDTAYSRYHTDVTIDTNDGTLDAPALSEGGTLISGKYYLASNPSNFTSNVGTITGITMNGASKGTSGVVDLGTVITDVSNKADLVDGKVPSSQLPSYVDDVLEYSAKANFPATGESGKIYVDTATNLTYRWGGSAYVEISPSLALGETASTAFAGNRGVALETAVGNLATVATSGSYNDLSNKPTIPTKVSQLTNDSGFLTSHQSLANYVTIDGTQTITGLKTFSQRPLSKDIYTKLEYIRSNATSSTVFPYIRTGVKRGVDYTNSEILSCVLDGYFTASQTYGFCGYDSGGQLGQANGKWSTEAGHSNVSALTRTTVTQVINFPSSYDRLYINGSQIANRTISSASSHAQNADYPLFVAYNGNFTYNPAKLVMYSFKMYIGDYATSPSTATLIRDFIPAKDPHGNIGLFDLVQQKFYKNSGNEDFVAGEEVETFGIDASLLTSYDVAKVALTNDYADLNNKPSIPTVNNGTLTIQKNGTTVATFTANQSGNATANISVPTKTSDLTNDSNFTSNVGTVTSVNNVAPVNGNVTLSIPSAVTESTVSGWGFTKNAGTVKSVNSNSPDANGNVSITIPSYTSKTAASGGTDVSLVTTGEKYTWNNKANSSDIKVTNATVSNTGSGNAVTSVSISNGQIVATKGSTFLTSHQSLSNYVTLNSAQTITAKKTITTSAGGAGLDVQISGASTGTNLTSIRGGSILIIPSSTSDQVYFGSTGITKYFTHSGSSPDTYTYTYPKKSGTIALTSDLPSTTNSVVSWQGRIYNLRTDNIDPKPGFWGCITWDKYAKKVRITGGFAPSTSGTTAYAKWPIDKILEQVGLTAADIRTPLGYDVGSATVNHSNNFVATSWMGVGATMRYDTNSDSGAGTAGLWYGRYYTMDSGAWGAYDVKTFCDNNFWVNFTAELEVN